MLCQLLHHVRPSRVNLRVRGLPFVAGIITTSKDFLRTHGEHGNADGKVLLRDGKEDMVRSVDLDTESVQMISMCKAAIISGHSLRRAVRGKMELCLGGSAG